MWPQQAGLAGQVSGAAERHSIARHLPARVLIDTGRFEAFFEAWARSFGSTLDREVVAIDGKASRGSFDRSRDQAAFHVVSAWASDRGLVLGQRQVGDKSNEITAIPELLDVLDIKGAIVTLDAMGCQRAIAANILEGGADYFVTLQPRPVAQRFQRYGVRTDEHPAPNKTTMTIIEFVMHRPING